MTATVNVQQALDGLQRALKEADLPGVEVSRNPHHIAVITDVGDFVIWASPWGNPVVYKVESAVDSYRCGAAQHVADLLRRLTQP